MLAREVRRLREAAIEREVKDLLCDGKITPAQAGMARALLRGMGTKERRTSNIQHSTSNDEVNGMNGNEKPVFSKKTGFWPDAEEVDVPEVFREFLAAIPRGAAIELGERTRGTKEGSRQKAEGSNGRMEGHEELARENLEIAGLTHRRDAEDAENG
jgi:hypothetical protein